MAFAAERFELLIIGGGPGGIATLLAAHKLDQLDSLLSMGLAVVESSDGLGKGSIGNYAINSDSGGGTFVDCLDAAHPTELTRLQTHELTKRLAAAEDKSVPLRDAGRFLSLVGQAIERMIASYPASAVFTRHKAQSARRCEDGWSVEISDLTSGKTRKIIARQLIIASGANQPMQRMAAEQFGGQSLTARCGTRLMQSGEVLTTDGLQRISKNLGKKAKPLVAILGGSTSAAAVAHALLHRLTGVAFGEAGITLMHRRPLRIYYPDRQQALAEGYTEWTEDDVCQISGRVFRFAGFRLDSRELVMQARGIGGRPAEARLRLHQLGADDGEAARILDQADIVVAAMGYRPRGLPLFDRLGVPITLLSQLGPQRPMVDSDCRVLDAKGQALPDVFGIGLAAGFVPRGRLGGEASFRGQANGLWLWQHDVGALIVNAVLAKAHSAPTRNDFLPAAVTSQRETYRSTSIVQG
ncbi:FAD-dependent oxidoreductase [Acidisoma cellulosilytica]|uniref:FAD-dependent oxidoreductase n=1 Tax=Acidisoma cellulosilyticum TaxID=2802395 RepID=A0A964E569_9PROT|nr:FAD-dependent oxidoreductase [Acidisoma cellulosilyticum]MCB8882092.1 FAD-dependent oxidoreductase [Acidisoma cellulosilyticum]